MHLHHCSRGRALVTAIGLCALLNFATAAEAPPASRTIPTGEEDAPAADAAAARAATSAATDQAQLEAELVEMTDESSEGLEAVRRADGTLMVDLEGRFQSVAVAASSEDGGYATSCHTGDEAVAHAKHAQDVASGKAPKATKPPKAAKPQAEEK